MRKYPKLKYPDDPETDGVFADGEIVISEKLDGANARWTLEEHLGEGYQTDWRDIIYGSRNVEYKNPEDESNQFSETIEYLRKTVDVEAVRSAEEEFGPLTFFGESMENPHTITEYRFEEIPLFIGFDIWQNAASRFLPREEAEHIFEQIGLETVPVIDIVRAEAWDEYDFEIPESAYGPVEAEGVVFKNHDTGVYAKFVREDFKERNNKTFGGKPSGETPDGIKLSRKYVTNARIENVAFSAVDDGFFDEICMEMMQPSDEWDGLATAVIRDMAQEEAANIFTEESYDELDIGDFRSDVASRSAQVLKQMLARRRRESL